MKTATYKDLKGREFEIEYDENASCITCGLPVIEASMGGTLICPWCDCGKYRDGESWTLEESKNQELIKQRAKNKGGSHADRHKPVTGSKDSGENTGGERT